MEDNENMIEEKSLDVDEKEEIKTDEEDTSNDDLDNELKDLLSEALLKNAKLEAENKKLQDDLNEAHRLFMNTGRSEEPEEKDYNSMIGDIK